MPTVTVQFPRGESSQPPAPVPPPPARLPSCHSERSEESKMLPRRLGPFLQRTIGQAGTLDSSLCAPQNDREDCAPQNDRGDCAPPIAIPNLPLQFRVPPLSFRVPPPDIRSALLSFRAPPVIPSVPLSFRAPPVIPSTPCHSERSEESKMPLSPNPPKDTDGRREGSGRGWVRELQGRWPGLLG